MWQRSFKRLKSTLKVAVVPAGQIWLTPLFMSCLVFNGILFAFTSVCIIFVILSLLPSTIHGRIDQVNQLLELDYQKRGGARYTALDKWTNQLNTLNQAIVSKLTWWHIKRRDKLACLSTFMYAYRASSESEEATHCTGSENVIKCLLLCCTDDRENTKCILYLFFALSFHVQQMLQ